MPGHSQRPVVIAVDAMSGDRGPDVVVKAAQAALQRHSHVSIVLTGPEPVLAALLGEIDLPRGRVSIEPAAEVVAMDDSPARALRGKKNSSMRRALELVKAGTADACVSAGNTGALVAKSRYVLKTMPGIDRPAIVSVIPARAGHTCMLDLGANPDCSATHLLQFAVMGSVIAGDIFEIDSPRVGLLNIGVESIKGTEVIQKAGELLQGSTLNYIGYVEGNDIFSGRADVVVSDGFTGNVALKTIEGAYREILTVLREEFASDPSAHSRLAALGARLDPRRYNGASLVGLRGVVIKSHGNADEFALANAIDLAMLESEKGVPDQIGEQLAQMFPDAEVS
ncbi:MAG: phosphate acyltransferase PlsX [Gammaproteobacteria bacterium]|nr:phosphate acyltransferase PlsX [Gammaproteobacteria bacterium]NNF59764.1 phosphate acyltransferase PlsX [Gammaproteobacteria bacterium]